MTSTPAIGRPSWSVSRPRTSPTGSSSISTAFPSALLNQTRMQPADPAVPAAGEQAEVLGVAPASRVRRPRQHEPALAVGRRRGHRLGVHPGPSIAQTWTPGTPAPALSTTRPGRSSGPGLGGSGLGDSRGQRGQAQHDGRDRTCAGSRQGRDEQGQPRQEHHLEHPFRQ